MTNVAAKRLILALRLVMALVCSYMVAFISGCDTEQQAVITIVLPQKVDSLIHDTTAVSYFVDSLKLRARNAKDDTTLINALADISAYWKVNEKLFAESALNLSIDTKYSNGITAAQCRLGNYYSRTSHFTRADSILNIALADANARENMQLKALALNSIGDKFRIQNEHDTAIVILQQARLLAASSGDRRRHASCLNAIGETYRMQTQFDSATKYFNEGLQVASAINDKDRMTKCLSGLGSIYRTQNNGPKALDYMQQALVIARSIKDRRGEAVALGSIGGLYFQEKDFLRARQYFDTSMVIAQELKDNTRIIYCQLTIGAGYEQDSIFSEAEKWYRDAYELATTSNNKDYASYALNALSSVHRQLGQYDVAMKECEDALAIASETGNRAYITSDLFNMAQIYMMQGEAELALVKTEEAFKLATEAQLTNDVMLTSEVLAWLYDTLGRHHEAFHMHVLNMKMKDSIHNEDQIRKFAATEFQLKEESYEAGKIKADEELKREKLVRNGFVGGSIIFAILAVVILYSLIQNRKAKKVIEQQKTEVEMQKQIVEEKQKEIVDSITYAKRLQTAILPSQSQFERIFPESFIFYRPKDIVAGDFYWMETIGDLTFIAAADSTGHGVPGAMVSVVCSNALNRAVKEFDLKSTGAILDKTTDIVLETFAKSETDVADGMDISLLAFNGKTNSAEWSGANNSLWYFIPGSDSFKEIKADKQPVGKSDYRKPFTTHSITDVKDSVFYLFTDGFADQFGGPKGKKFKQSQLQTLLLAGVQLPMTEQSSRLSEAFDKWKAYSNIELEQVDDVTVLGIRL